MNDVLNILLDFKNKCELNVTKLNVIEFKYI
jgi:hypothetical protein